eukprot:1160872-Pelagomonas_calceolata.AAC.7
MGHKAAAWPLFTAKDKRLQHGNQKTEKQNSVGRGNLHTSTRKRRHIGSKEPPVPSTKWRKGRKAYARL